MSTITNLKVAAVAEGVALRLPGYELKPHFGVEVNNVHLGHVGSHIRLLLTAIAATKKAAPAARDIALKRAAVAEGRALKLPGWAAKVPFGVTLTVGRGDKINALLRALAAYNLPVPVVKDPAWWMEDFLNWNEVHHNMHYRMCRPIDYDLPPVDGHSSYTDCSGTTTAAFKRAGWADPNGRGYDGTGNTATQVVHGKAVSLAQAKRNDLVFYAVRGSSEVEHVAMCVSPGRVISHGHEGDPGNYDAATCGDPGYLHCVEVRRYA